MHQFSSYVFFVSSRLLLLTGTGLRLCTSPGMLSARVAFSPSLLLIAMPSLSSEVCLDFGLLVHGWMQGETMKQA